MNREIAYSLISQIMSEQRAVKGRVTRSSSKASCSDESTSTSNNINNTKSSDEEEEGLGCRTFYDFENENALPNLTIKTFLRDCVRHPKILYHKEFQFFRRFLMDLGIEFKLPPDSAYCEDHEDTTFCVDKGDKWLNELKKRVNPENDDYHWASILPVKRRSDLGLIIFRWEVSAVSMHFLHVYLKFCEAKTDPGEDMDDYIEDFKRLFDIEKNMDVEVRLKGDMEAREFRKANNLVEPIMTPELAALLKTPPKRKSSNRTGTSNGRRVSYTSEESSSSSTSSDDSSGSEYYGTGTRKRRRKPRKVTRNPKKTKQSSNNTPGSTVNGIPKPVSNGARAPRAGTSNDVQKPTKSKTNVSNKPAPRLICNICTNGKVFASRQLLYKHMKRQHTESTIILVECKCGIKMRKETFAFHKQICKA